MCSPRRLVFARRLLSHSGRARACFRREPSREVNRRQSFRMREFVAIGAPEWVLNFRKHWIGRAPKIGGALGLRTASRPRAIPFSAALAPWSEGNKSRRS